MSILVIIETEEHTTILVALIWMLCGKAANDNIDRVHKRALRILLDDHESKFEASLAKNGETNIHTQNFRMLLSGIYKTFKNTNPPFMQEYFIRKDVKYDLRTRDQLQIPAAKSITFGTDSTKFRGSLLWNSIPDLIQRASSASKGTSKIGVERNAIVRYVDNAHFIPCNL